MAPNLFLCLRTICCPVYWFQRRERVHSLNIEEHWDSPVPGTYKYTPGRGWYLVHRDGHTSPEKEPVRLVYCRILHRHLLEHEMEERCRWESVTVREGNKPEKFMFFLLDDGFTWVTGWDAMGNFIPGPYRKWCFDPETNAMRRMKSCESSNVSRSSSIVPER